MHRTLIALAFSLVSPALCAQSVVQPVRIPAPARDAGTYHLATGTWTRASTGTTALGSVVIYNNDAFTGYYHPINPIDAVVDEGRIPMGLPYPGPGSFQADYHVDGFQIGYCTSETSVDIAATFFESYVPCTDPVAAPPPVGRVDLDGVLPASLTSGQLACWVVTVDLAGTTDEFCLAAEGGDGVFDNDPALDSIGISLTIGDNVSGPAGFMIAGDPNNAPFGDGTAFQNPGLLGTGANEQDQFFIKDTTGGPSGCFDFGGYPAAPWGGHYMRIYAQPGNCGSFGTHYCTSTPNSSGSPGTILVQGGSPSIAANNLVLRAASVPDIPGIGIFIGGPGQAQVPLFNGYLCVSPAGLQRINQVTPPVNGVVTQAIDFTGASTGTAPLSVMAGVPYHFQYWFRDPMSGGGFANFTDGIRIDMEL
jgi:hypothetical protein